MTAGKKKKTLLLVDGNALIHRAYHAFPKTFHTKDGELINAVYGFSSALLAVLGAFKPDGAVVAFDVKGKTFRHEAYEGYKARRPKMDEELRAQISRVHEVVESMGISAFGITGYEADDLIGTIVNKMKARKEWEVGIVTGDKDALQLLNGHVFVYFPSRGRIGAQRIDSKKFIEKYGFAPENLVDFKALAGDPSDDIPGVAGVGQKTAEVLIKEFAEVEKVYESLDKIPERVRTKLEKSRELAFLSKELARIDRNVPLKFELEDCHFELGHLAHVKELFKELNFSSLIRRVDGMIGTLNKVSGEVKESNKIEQMSFF